MNLSVSKVSNGFTVMLRDPNRLCTPNEDIYVALNEEDLMKTLRDIIMTGLVTEKLTGEKNDGLF